MIGNFFLVIFPSIDFSNFLVKLKSDMASSSRKYQKWTKERSRIKIRNFCLFYGHIRNFRQVILEKKINQFLVFSTSLSSFGRFDFSLAK